MSIHLANGPHKTLSTFNLVMINIIAMDTLRTLPFSAKYGFSTVFFYLLAALLFFLPIALISAELATGWPNTGGLYVWVKEAFGKKWAFFIIWLQWIYNVVWYPAILSFIAVSMVFFIDPELAQNKWFMLFTVLSLIWLTTLVNCFGMRFSGIISAVGAILGSIFPMLLIISLAIVWVMQGNPSHMEVSVVRFFPDTIDISNLAFFTVIIFGLIGIEMSAAHAEEVKNPGREYPRAMLISASVIVVSLILSSMAIATVVPREELGLASGLLQAFAIFFDTYDIAWMKPIIAVLIVLGEFACVSAWVIGPTKGLWAASAEGSIPVAFQRLNKHYVPIPILILQAVIVTLVCSVFLLMPSVNSSYWLLSALTAQLALLAYIGLFAASVKLRDKPSPQPRGFHIPGGKWGTRILAGVGITTCVTGILIGFIPPEDVQVGNIVVYEALLVGGIILFCLPPFILNKLAKPEWKRSTLKIDESII